MNCKKVFFIEDGFCIREIEKKQDYLQAFKLRHKIYCEFLKWVESSPDGLEMDRYDFFSTSLGVFSQDEELVGVIRIIPSGQLFMLEKEFRNLVSLDRRIRKEKDTAEITRLTTLAPLHHKGLKQHQVSLLLYKGVYQWSLFNRIRYLYFVVEERFFRVLKRVGFPCLAVGPVTTLRDGVKAVATILDWEVFRSETGMYRPDFLKWITNLSQENQMIEPMLRPERDSELSTFSSH